MGGGGRRQTAPYLVDLSATVSLTGISFVMAGFH